MDSITYNDETVVRSELPLLMVVVYLPRIQILVVGGYPATTLMGRPFGRSGRASDENAEIAAIRSRISSSSSTVILRKGIGSESVANITRST
jgi:hypothetical protein